MRDRTMSVAAGLAALLIVAVLATPISPGRIAAVVAAPLALQASPEADVPLPPAIDAAVEPLPDEIEITLLARAEMGGLRSNGNTLSLESFRIAAGEAVTHLPTGTELVAVLSGAVELSLGGQDVAIDAGGQFVASAGDAYQLTGGASGAEILRLRFEPDGDTGTPEVSLAASPVADGTPRLLVSGEANRLVSRRGTLFIARVTVPPGVETGTQTFTGPVGVAVVSGSLTVSGDVATSPDMELSDQLFVPAFTPFDARNDGEEAAELIIAGLFAPPTGDARGPEGTVVASPTADALGTAQADLTAMAGNVSTLATREAAAASTAIALQTAVSAADTNSAASQSALATAQAETTALAAALATSEAESAAANASAEANVAAAEQSSSSLEATIVALQAEIVTSNASAATAEGNVASLESTVLAQETSIAAAETTSIAMGSQAQTDATTAAEQVASLEASQAAAATAAAATAEAQSAALADANATIEAQAAAATATLAAANATIETQAVAAATGAAVANATAAAYDTALTESYAAATAGADAANATASALAASGTEQANAASATIAAGNLDLFEAEATIVALTTAEAEAAGRAVAAVDPNYVDESIQVDLDGVLAGDPAAIQQAEAAVADALRPYKDTCRAGVVLTFGHGRSIGQGTQLAEAINVLIRSRFPTAFGTAGYDAFGDLNPPLGQVDIRIYLFTGCTPIFDQGATPQA